MNQNDTPVCSLPLIEQFEQDLDFAIQQHHNEPLFTLNTHTLTARVLVLSTVIRFFDTALETLFLAPAALCSPRERALLSQYQQVCLYTEELTLEIIRRRHDAHDGQGDRGGADLRLRPTR